MDKYMNVINYNELDNYLVENPNTILYVSILDNEDIRTFEKKFKNEFKNKKINNELLYMNLTVEINDKNISEELENKYYIKDLSIVDVPSILVFSMGELKTIYNIADNNYDIVKTVEFINSFNMNVKGL